MTTMPTPTEVAYYEWLTSQVDIPNGKTYNKLFEIMHNTEFVWTVPHDDNRIADGIELRREFLSGPVRNIHIEGATFLEVLIALSRRVAFISGVGNESNWAWNLIHNLGLKLASDPMSNEWKNRVDTILHTVIWRTYREDGMGGFFPLQNAEQNQKSLDIWYQMNAYVAEMTDL